MTLYIIILISYSYSCVTTRIDVIVCIAKMILKVQQDLEPDSS